MKRIITAIALCALVPAVLLAERSVDESRDAARDGVVEIRNVAGSIEVSGWDRSEVHVSGTLGEDVEELVFESRGDRTIIKVILPERRNVKKGHANLEIRVPRGSRVEAEGVSADVVAEGVRGDLALSSVSGDIDISGDPKQARGESVSGDINIDGSISLTVAQSVSGDVDIRGVTGSVSGASVSGDVKVKGKKVEKAQLKTTSGDVSFSGTLTRDASLHAETVSGDVRLSLPGGTSADFEASTFSGNIQNAFGPEAHRTSKYAPGKELSFTEGAGGATIRIKSFSGTVTIDRN